MKGTSILANYVILRFYFIFFLFLVLACLLQVIVGQFAESDGDKDMAQRLLDILYATEDGFAIPEEENGMPAPPEEF